jgi:hypothetical protein
MPSSTGDDGDDHSIEGENLKRYKNKIKHLNEWKDQADPKKRLSDKDEIKSRPNQNNETLYVHLVANTHDDVGWIKTVD